MPLSARSPTILHVLQNIILILIALIFLPLLTFITITSNIISPYLRITKTIAHTRQWRAKSSSTYRPRTILVTGMGMSKGLTIARSFYRAGHRVIGADFEPHSIPVCGRFSTSISKFYRLRRPTKASGTQEYIDDLLRIAKEEGVQLWVSCSGVASAVEDGEAKEALEKIGVLAVQFGVEITSLLHEKDSFIKNTKSLGLNVPETHLITSTTDALSILHPSHSGSPIQEKTYILKSVGLDDSIRADMTRLPLHTQSATRNFISKLDPSPSRPFVLQEFVAGPEYCTHSIAIRGRIKAFTVCESSELLMHYRALPPTSTLFKAMLRYTKLYAEKKGEDFTGHFSIDFLLQGDSSSTQSSGGTDGELEDLIGKLFPIECNPRAHTAAVLFANQSIALSDAYLSLLPDYEVSQKTSRDIVMPSSQTPGYYWIGHDVLTRVILPVLHLLTMKIGVEEVIKKWLEFLNHLIFWKDGTWEVWDPWPFWWLYAVYWPGMFLVSIRDRSWWSRCNVSTTKMFRC